LARRRLVLRCAGAAPVDCVIHAPGFAHPAHLRDRGVSAARRIYERYSRAIYARPI
jgi:hypothetical protein